MSEHETPPVATRMRADLSVPTSLADDGRPPFKAARLKIARAQRHTQELRSIIDAYVSTDPILFTNEPDHPFGHSAPNVTIGFTKFLYPPNEIPTVIGDAVHNLRAALDLMIGAIARGAGRTPEEFSFPFAKNEATLNKQLIEKRFRLLGRDTVAMIRRYRPFTGGNMELRGLHDLDITDKHRHVIPAPGVASADDLALFVDRFGVRGRDLRPDRFHFIFPEELPFAGDGIVDRLEALTTVVTAVVVDFENMVSSRQAARAQSQGPEGPEGDPAQKAAPCSQTRGVGSPRPPRRSRPGN